MSDLSILTKEQLIARHRHLADQVLELQKKIEPLYEEYEKLRQEYLQVDTELAKKYNLPTIDSVTDNQE